MILLAVSEQGIIEGYFYSKFAHVFGSKREEEVKGSDDKTFIGSVMQSAPWNIRKDDHFMDMPADFVPKFAGIGSDLEMSVIDMAFKVREGELLPDELIIRKGGMLISKFICW